MQLVLHSGASTTHQVMRPPGNAGLVEAECARGPVRRASAECHTEEPAKCGGLGPQAIRWAPHVWGACGPDLSGLAHSSVARVAPLCLCSALQLPQREMASCCCLHAAPAVMQKRLLWVLHYRCSIRMKAQVKTLFCRCGDEPQEEEERRQVCFIEGPGDGKAGSAGNCFCSSSGHR